MTKMNKNGRDKEWQRERVGWICSDFCVSYRLLVIWGSYFW